MRLSFKVSHERAQLEPDGQHPRQGLVQVTITVSQGLVEAHLRAGNVLVVTRHRAQQMAGNRQWKPLAPAAMW